MAIFLVAILSLCLSFIAAQGCSCEFASMEQHVCASEISFRGRVLGVFDNCSGRTCDPLADQGGGRFFYIVKVNILYKGNMPEDGIAFLRTTVNSALCGTSFTIGSEYLFNLRNSVSFYLETCPDRTYDVSNCDGHYLWSSLTIEQKFFAESPLENCT